MFKNTPSVVYTISALFFIFTLAACKNETLKLPIPKEKMINVLIDIHTAEALMESESPTVKDSMAKIYYSQIFKHNAITAKEYDSTFSIISNNADLMKSVYDSVVAKTESRLKAIQQDTTKK